MPAVTRRRLLVAGAVLVIVWLAVAAFRVVQVRHDLLAAKAAASAVRIDLKDGNVDAVRRDIAVLQHQADGAGSHGRSLSLRLASHIPFAGGQVREIRTLSDAVRMLSRDSLAPASQALTTLQDKPPLSDGAVDLATVSSLSGTVDRAVAGLDRARTSLDRSPSQHLLGALKGARAALIEDTDKLDGDIKPLQRALHLAPGMLGATGPRTYLIAVQNPAEARGTGGLIAAYSLVRLDKGHLSTVSTGTNLDFGTTLADIRGVYRGLQAGAAQAQAATQTFFGVNALPDWPRASAELATLWQARFHSHLDGVIGITPAALARVLSVVGPVHLSDGTTVSSTNAVHFIQVDEYGGQYAQDNSARKSSIGQLASLITDKLVHSKLALTQLRDAVKPSLGTGDLTLWSADGVEEKQLLDTTVSGALPDDPGLVQVVDVNTGGGKMDAYLQRHVTVHMSPGAVTVTTTFTNTVQDPAGLFPIQASRLDDNKSVVPRGSARDLVSVYGGTGAGAGSVTVDGKPFAALVETDQGHPRISVDLEVHPGQTRTIVVVLKQSGQVHYRLQPLAVPEKWDLNGAP